MNRSDKFVSADGGKISFVGDAGEVLAVIAVPAGIVDVAQYLDLLPHGAKIEIDGGLWLASPPIRSGRVVSDLKFESAANVDYIPASASELMQRQILQRLALLSKAQERSDARVRASQALVIPKGQANFDDDPDVIETNPDPVAVDKPAPAKPVKA